MVASINSSTQAAPSPAASIDLIAMARQFRSDPQQVKLIQWLQASTGQQRQAEFAQMWRNGEQQGATGTAAKPTASGAAAKPTASGAAAKPIDFVQVFRFYQGRPHQNAALKWLQQTSQPKTLEGFARMWQQVPAPQKNRELRLNVPYYEQTNNLYEPQRTCNTSSCAMVARFLGAKISGDDAYYQIVRRYGDTTDHGAQTRALAEIGIQSTWHTNLGYDDLDKSLEAGLPIVIGILHRGTMQSPTGGHMIVVIGRTPTRDYICHDPYGSLLDPNGGYTGAVENGRGVVYPRFVLNRRWLVEGEQSGWGRLFQANKSA